MNRLAQNKPVSDLPFRKKLPHGVPGWVNKSDYWLITICCSPRNVNQLANTKISTAISEAFLYYQEKGQLKYLIWTAMPDHLHFIARFKHSYGMKNTVNNLKHYLASKHKIKWQKGFFDHRLRCNKECDAKFLYVRLNPVRASLVINADDWPHRS